MTTQNADVSGEQAQWLTQLTAGHHEELLRLARAAIVAYLETGQIPEYETADPILNRNAGAFITLRRRIQPGNRLHEKWATAPGARLRGCIGRLESDHPLYRVVPETAVKSATGDPRFPPLTAVELDDINIEISILSPLFLVTDVRQIEIGAHGLVIVGEGGQRGSLLPQVPVAHGWGREEFLQNLCHKAGLPTDYWCSKATLYAFSTVRFEDDEIGL